MLGLRCSLIFLLHSVISSLEGQRNVMKLSHRMVKSFCEVLSMSDKLDFPHLSDQNSGVRVSLRRSNGAGQPEGFIVSAATSLWLPLSKEDLFNFFKDEKKRAEVVYMELLTPSLFDARDPEFIFFNISRN